MTHIWEVKGLTGERSEVEATVEFGEDEGDGEAAILRGWR